ncbi:MarR family transcriptional regulator [Nitrosovibrio sp. Nv17]|uniref:MarR family transcriptional regulator n=1 Tax=Nitrosovibrio sp. Nv17 TaxID=1855339 RepID=UPI000908B3A2|nr:MarR family transcriptional regulator [Nitrosovibrio sp. Nv17]SFW21591.1 hypothetical protein SAMN05216414_10680 [Nitrosovibrio sp. Nv17]
MASAANPAPGASEASRDARRRWLIRLIHDTDRYWIDILGDARFHDLNYYDLFTRMWLRLDTAAEPAFRKSELYRLMPNVSQRTAIRHVQAAIDQGLLIEHADPSDLRSRRITLSDDLRQRVERFLDYSLSVLEASPLPGRTSRRP